MQFQLCSDKKNILQFPGPNNYSMVISNTPTPFIMLVIAYSNLNIVIEDKFLKQWGPGSHGPPNLNFLVGLATYFMLEML